ncbi:MAG: hypothetical protein AAFN93_13880 [Bacteroidota bacterium]
MTSLHKKFENLDGPVYTVDKNTVFMIKYANGSKDVFSAEKSLVNNNSENESATIYFYRPKKMASSSAKIIIGTSDPDEVVVKLRNGSWYKTEYTHIGNRNFLAGVFIINPETFDIEIEPGETYYFKCTILSKGFKIMAEMETMEKETAEEDMKKLKEQTKNYVN